MYYLLEAHRILGGTALDLNMPAHALADDASPSGGGGVPRVLMAQLDWMAKMANADGSVHYWVGYPAQFRDPHGMVSNISSSSAAVLAAVYAKAARVLPERCADNACPQLDAYIATLLRRARTSWDWLQANPFLIHPTEGIHYGYETTMNEDLAYRVWAAVELYETTGEAPFRRYAEANLDAMLAEAGETWRDTGPASRVLPAENPERSVLVTLTGAAAATDPYGAIPPSPNRQEMLPVMAYADSRRAARASCPLQTRLRRKLAHYGRWIARVSDGSVYHLPIASPNSLYWGSNGLLVPLLASPDTW